ncbi:(2Fe-2S)-binding protein [bacterium]|nr:(2Fe-2S)-binding protein [bacterium]
MSDEIRFKLNGETVSYSGNMVRRLLDVLRDDFGLLGIKEGCGEGECGACSVLLNSRNVPSCITLIGAVDGSEIYTIEGIRNTEQFAVLSESFAEAGAVQCGFCTPGMIIASLSLLEQNPSPTREQIQDALSGNLCRCSGMNMIIEAIQIAANKGGVKW